MRHPHDPGTPHDLRNTCRKSKQYRYRNIDGEPHAKSRTVTKTEDTRHVRIARNTHRQDKASANWQFVDLLFGRRY
jgi:hypothetical protein